MIADSNQTGALKVSRQTRSIRYGLIVRWLILGLAVTSLLGGLFWNYNLVRYPGAKGQEAALYQC